MLRSDKLKIKYFFVENPKIPRSSKYLKNMKSVFITGGTGYMGSRLIKTLLKTGSFDITALTRKESEHKLPAGCRVVIGNALDANSFMDSVAGCDIYIHLIGVSHPGPSKKEQFSSIDQVSIQQSVLAAKRAGVKHFVYVSVANYPTKIMQAYQQARADGEALLTTSGIPCCILRPWYVIGPAHWWPLLLKPFYVLAKCIPSFREAAIKLDTVTLKQMLAALVKAVSESPLAIKYYEVENIKKC
jgi:uncharacterized protein YbjT (DUF2867 family)